MNATVTGFAQGYASIGGLVGIMRGGSVSNVQIYGTVTGVSGGSVGGLVGNVNGSYNISNSSFNGTLSAYNMLAAGGLVGENSGTITNSYSLVQHQEFLARILF